MRSSKGHLAVASLFPWIVAAFIPQVAHAAPEASPKLPQVDDAMLTPVPAADRTLRDWNDARSLLRTRSTDLAIALAEVRRADAQARTALAAALPNINLSVAATRNLITNDAAQIAGADANGNPLFRPIQVPVPNILSGNVSAQVPVFDLRTWYAVGTARRNARAAALSTEDIKRSLVITLASAVVSVYTSERVAELNRIGLRNALERLALTERRQTLGAGNGLDVVRAQQDVETARQALVAGDESLRQARESLGLALGLPEQVGVPESLKLDALANGALSSCKTNKNVDSRADVAALKQRAEVGARQVTNARLQFLPTIVLQSTASTTSQDTGALPRTLWNVQAVLSLPIWDGGARYGALRDSNAQLDQSLMQLEAQRRQVTIEGVRSLRGVAVAENNMKVSEKSRDLALENDRLTRASYAEGRGTSLELVASAATLRETEINLALREFELVQARINAALVLAKCTI